VGELSEGRRIAGIFEQLTHFFSKLIERLGLFYSPHIPDPLCKCFINELIVIVRLTKPTMPQGKSPGKSVTQQKVGNLSRWFLCDKML